jgi:Ca2+-binding EF-hand superfamily protein
MDADGDGNVSFEEAQASQPDLTEASFAEMDSNADGVLDQGEVEAAVTAGQLPAQG